MKQVEIDLEQFSDNDIAIVGVAARVPGALNAADYWHNLKAGIESVKAYSEEELLAAGEKPDMMRRSNYVASGAPLERMEYFDGEFFGFSPKECAILDPQHRQFLESAWEALEDAGHPPEKFPGPIGVFAGCGMGSYFYFNLCTNPDLVKSVGLFLLRHTGNDKDFLATRLSYLLNLTGPSINVQTACSTSLVAVHLACQSIMSGECDMALAGGVTLELPHRRGYLFHENEILSPDGHCHAFDHRSQGTIFGSGAGIVVLRRLKDAIADGDQIYSVIKATAVNNDGASKAGYLAPSVDGQASAIVEALGIAGVTADTIDYVECHGTGTYLGDPIEIAALSQAFRQTTDKKGYCRVGSVKSNIGHLDTAAGVASLIKVSLALKNEAIPASLNFEKPNPTIDFENSPFIVNSELTSWPRKAAPRRAGVNSLGVGGTNAHVILEEAPALPASSKATRPFQLLTLSARTRAALDAQCAQLADHLEKNVTVNLADVAFTLKEARRAFEQRRVLACKDHAEAIELLRSKDARRVFSHTNLGEGAKIVFMFPGGGAQYIGMAKGLYDAEPEFRKYVDQGLSYLKPKIDYDLKALLFAEGDAVEHARQQFQKPSVQLPALFIIEYSLAKLLISRGLEPESLIGHSMGENTAACLAQVLSYQDGVGLVHLRGKLFDTIPAGGMLSVPMAVSELKLVLHAHPQIDVACVNSPELCVASGPKDALAALQAALLERGVEAQRIAIDIAAHSRMLEPMLDQFGAYLRGISLRAPKIPFISNRSGTWITTEQATSPEYWVQHLRNTVHFADGITTLASDDKRIFLEVGPGKTLGSLSKQNSTVKPQCVLSSLRHPEEIVDDNAFFLTLMGRLWALGVALKNEQLWPDERRVRVSLPTYPFQGQRYWIEPGKAEHTEEAGRALSKIADPERWFYQAVWRRHDAEQAEHLERSTWLVFMDDAGIGEELVTRLRARGDDVVTVRDGDAFYKLSDHEYRLSPEHGRDGYEALVRDLLASGKAPNRIAHLWLIAKNESFRPGSTFFHRNQERGFYSLLFLAQALSSEEYPRPLHLSVVSSGMQRIGNEVLLHPDQATVLGPCKVIPHEFAGVTCSSVDITVPRSGNGKVGNGINDGLFGFARSTIGAALPLLTGATKSASNGHASWVVSVVDNLERELLAAPGNRVVALRGDERWLEQYERHPGLASMAATPAFREHGVYLITGGFGGIGLTLGKHLAQHYRARLVLVNRTPLPAREQWPLWLERRPLDPLSDRIRRVQELERLGAEVLPAAADVTDAERMSEVLFEAKQKFGVIHGVIHAAGTVNDGLIPTKRQADIEAVFSSKVYGTRVLHEVLRNESLDFLVLFSSTSTAIAAAGQVDYVAANSFLNAYAEASRARRTIALNWGVWAEVGMAAGAARKLGIVEERPPTEEEATHPLFEKRVTLDDAINYYGSYSSSKAWVLDEHRTADRHALLPGTGYLELARAALTERGEPGVFEIRDLFFFRPLYVPDGEDKRVRVRLTNDERGYNFEVQSERTLESRTGWERHAQAKLSLVNLPAASPIGIEDIVARCTQKRLEDSVGIRSRQEEHLLFGPRWRVLKRAYYGEGEALGFLELADKFVGDLAQFCLHPALLDIATGFAMNLIRGYESENEQLWVPLTYRRVRVRRPLEQRIYSWVRNHGENSTDNEFASFDITIVAEDGSVLVEVEEFTIKKLAHANFAVARAPSASELEFDIDHSGRELSPAEFAFQQSLKLGILPEEGVRAFEQVLGASAVSRIFVSSIELPALIEQAAKYAPEAREEGGAKFSRPQLDTEYVAPRDDVERTLVEIWEELLGVDQVGVQDNFFDLGGHSLIAVRLFAKIKKIYSVEFAISILFGAPTIEKCATLIKDVIGVSESTAAPEAKTRTEDTHQTRYTHLVAMHRGEAGKKQPFFLCAGMFGNVLNLRHLAHLIGTDRPFYGLQARGLYGDHEPHETFEEMGRDYLAEIRSVQPHGPYMLGGFSGGGIAAYEIARQLREAGEEVSLLVMLDTPIPKDDPLTLRDKLAIHRRNLERKGANYIVDWVKKKYEYKAFLRDREAKLKAQLATTQSHDFHSQVIEAAFYRALDRYELAPQPISVVLFRPKLKAEYELGLGRAINVSRRLIYFDNGWAPFVDRVEVNEVPGDHDSMVLEPNVRVLATRLRECIEEAEAQVRERSAGAKAPSSKPRESQAVSKTKDGAALVA